MPQLTIHLAAPCRKCPKKVSAATFTSDGEHAIFADKFGDVYVAATAAPEQVIMTSGLDVMPASTALVSSLRFALINPECSAMHISAIRGSSIAHGSHKCFWIGVKVGER